MIPRKKMRIHKFPTKGVNTLKKIHVVLYEPEIPQNTGNISRTCAVTGAALHIIRPTGFEISDKTLKRAGLDYWDKLDVFYYDSYGEFCEKNPSENKFYSSVEFPDECYLIFGKETMGLPRELIENNPDRALRMPMRKTLRCLNLSNAVAIAVYEALRQGGFDGLE